jgi:hypothetical protein
MLKMAVRQDAKGVTMNAMRTAVLASEVSAVAAVAAALLLSCCLCLPVGAIAEPAPSPTPSYQGIYATVGLAQKNNRGISNGLSGGLGIRGEHWGMKLCYVDNPEVNTDNISILPSLFAQAPLVDLGNKRVAEYGYDIDGYINVNRTISLYAGPGLYYVAQQDIQQEQYSNGLRSSSYFGGPTTVKFIPTAEGGIHLNIPFSSKGSGRLLLGVGYHTQRGLTFDLGLRF